MHWILKLYAMYSLSQGDLDLAFKFDDSTFNKLVIYTSSQSYVVRDVELVSGDDFRFRFLGCDVYYYVRREDLEYVGNASVD